jgi:diketogulonate reductase-like aldo/keto reductase
MITVNAGGIAIPALGLGTMKLTGEAGAHAVEQALRLGYRHLDTAAAYGNEAQVGEGLRASGVDRASVFVTTKVWRDDMAAANVLRSAEASLERLGLDQVDLLLLHWPNPAVPLEESVGALCRAKRMNLARAIGVANYPTALFDRAQTLADEPLVTNQVEYHPFLSQRRVLETVRRHGSSLTAYAPLARGAVAQDATLVEIARAHQATASQVSLRWLVQQPQVVAIPKTAQVERLKQNLDIFDFSLSDTEMDRISALARPDGRVVRPPFAPQWDLE